MHLEPVAVSCPYCGERVELALDPQSVGEMVHDCEVCCNPWRLVVRREADGRLAAEAEPAQ